MHIAVQFLLKGAKPFENIFHSYMLCESQTTILFYLFCLCSLSFCFFVSLFLCPCLFLSTKFSKIWYFSSYEKSLILKHFNISQKWRRTHQKKSHVHKPGKICGGEGLEDFCLKKLLPSKAIKPTAGNLGGHGKLHDEVQGSEFRENFEINVSWTPGSHIFKVLSVDNSENHPSNDQTLQTSVHKDRQLLI